MIYLDNAATTKPSILAIEQANKFNKELFFNPSALYDGGILVKRELKQCREYLLSVLGTSSHELIFTSCGSESDNYALKCFSRRGPIIVSEGEHSAIFQTANALKSRGTEVYFAPLNKDGSVNVSALYSLIKEKKPTLVSIIHVNNETGAINDINTIAKEIKKIDSKIIFHSDGVQAFGKLNFRLSENLDLYSVSAHKINGLKGVGAIFKKKTLNGNPLIDGGGQEFGQRSGTENVFGIKVFEYVAKERFDNLEKVITYVSDLKTLFINNLKGEYFNIISSAEASPFIVTMIAKNVKGEVMLHMLEEFGICIGVGSACSSKNKINRVINACGYSLKEADGVLRISFSPDNTEEEIKYSAQKINEVYEKLNKIING